MEKTKERQKGSVPIMKNSFPRSGIRSVIPREGGDCQKGLSPSVGKERGLSFSIGSSSLI
jgi:hypothetical protein